MGSGDPRVQCHRPGQWRTGCLREPRNVPTRALPGLIGRDNQLLGMCAAVCFMLAARLPVRARQAGCCAHSASNARSLIDLGSAVNVVSGRVDPDHHRAVDTVRVPPLVRSSQTGPGALAEQVDALVAEGDASGFDVVGLLSQRVAGEVNAASLKPLRARGEGLGVRAQRRFAEVISGVLQRRRHLGQFSTEEPSTPR